MRAAVLYDEPLLRNRNMVVVNKMANERLNVRHDHQQTTDVTEHVNVRNLVSKTQVPKICHCK
jgi:hypothetical protein